MKRLLTALVALSMTAPSVAFAEPAAQSLSLSNAVGQPLRATAKMGKKLKAEGDNTLLIVAGVVIAAGVACLIWCGGSNNVPSP